MGMFMIALRNKKEGQTLCKKKNLTLLSQYITCYLTAYYVEKNPFLASYLFLGLLGLRL